MTLLGDAQLVVTGPVTDPVQHGKGLGRPLRPVLAQRPHVGLVGRIEARDDGVDLPTVDTPTVVDAVDEQIDGLGLLAELRVGGESLLSGQ